MQNYLIDSSDYCLYELSLIYIYLGEDQIYHWFIKHFDSFRKNIIVYLFWNDPAPMSEHVCGQEADDQLFVGPENGPCFRLLECTD